MAQLVPLSGWRQHAHLIAKARRMKRAIEKVARSQTHDKEQRLQDGYRRLIDYGQMIVERALDSYAQVKALNVLAPPRVGPAQRKPCAPSCSTFWCNGVHDRSGCSPDAGGPNDPPRREGFQPF